MRKSIGLVLLVSVFVFGCGHVTQEQLQAEVARSQQDLREELSQDIHDGDSASFDCSLAFSTYQSAARYCSLGHFCNVVDVYENYCLQTDEDDNLLPQRRGVMQAMREAAEAYQQELQSSQ